jgi:hypothetical protein
LFSVKIDEQTYKNEHTLTTLKHTKIISTSGTQAGLSRKYKQIFNPWPGTIT